MESLLRLKEEKALSVVRLERVAEGFFEKEIIGSGKLKARNKADLAFPFDEQILSVRVQNGQRVRKGLLLAQLDTFELRLKINKALEQQQKALTEAQHQLITLGYDLEDSLKIPPEKWALVKRQNGYNGIELDLQSLRHQLKQAQIRAPFSGIIADLEAKAFNQSGRYNKLCTLIDDRSLEVEFQIMEAEYPLIQLNQQVELQAFYAPDKTYRGRITQVNPTVDEHGMLKVWANVRRANSQLIEGMNVKVKVKKAIDQQLIIPKAAVVNRQNRSVVFTYEDGVAKWNYVELGWENSREVTVQSGLQAGQSIIVSGNLDLAHNVAVLIDTVLVN